MGQGALSKPVVQWWLSLNSSTSDARSTAAHWRCDGGMAADGQGEAMAMADGRRGGQGPTLVIAC